MSITLLEALNSGVNLLEEKGIGNPRSSAEVLLCSVLNLNRVDLYLNKDQVLKDKDKKIFDKFLEERVSGKPIQYITGSTEFLDLEFTGTQHRGHDDAFNTAKVLWKTLRRYG